VVITPSARCRRLAWCPAVPAEARKASAPPPKRGPMTAAELRDKFLEAARLNGLSIQDVLLSSEEETVPWEADLRVVGAAASDSTSPTESMLQRIVVPSVRPCTRGVSALLASKLEQPSCRASHAFCWRGFGHMLVPGCVSDHLAASGRRSCLRLYGFEF
jgi:hypothetical protein